MNRTFRAARTLGKLSGWTLTQLQMQKLLYLAHMVHLARCHAPLVGEQFEAWQYGPVLPSLYRKLKAFGNEHVRDVFYGVETFHKGQELEVLREAYEALGRVSASKLVAMTHRSSGAWARHYVPGGNGKIIPDADILSEAKGY